VKVVRSDRIRRRKGPRNRERVLLRREDFIVSCAQQTLVALFTVVVRRTIGLLRNDMVRAKLQRPAYYNS
jgi:hypothetical protein